MRVALAQALFANPSLLLLDEPTNHLDLDACVWLEATLRRLDGTLIVVSHSQDLLNAVCTKIMHLTVQGTLEVWGGDYATFVKAKEERDRNLWYARWSRFVGEAAAAAPDGTSGAPGPHRFAPPGCRSRCLVWVLEGPALPVQHAMSPPSCSGASGQRSVAKGTGLRGPQSDGPQCAGRAAEPCHSVQGLFVIAPRFACGARPNGWAPPTPSRTTSANNGEQPG